VIDSGNNLKRLDRNHDQKEHTSISENKVRGLSNTIPGKWGGNLEINS